MTRSRARRGCGFEFTLVTQAISENNKTMPASNASDDKCRCCLKTYCTNTVLLYEHRTSTVLQYATHMMRVATPDYVGDKTVVR